MGFNFARGGQNSQARRALTLEQMCCTLGSGTAHSYNLRGGLTMCGRFTLRNTSDEIARVFNIQAFEAPLDARYNIAPQQTVLAVVQRGESNVATPMGWGLVPFWAKDEAIGNQLINARAETLAEKPSFNRPLKSQRCLV